MKKSIKRESNKADFNATVNVSIDAGPDCLAFRVTSAYEIWQYTFYEHY